MTGKPTSSTGKSRNPSLIAPVIMMKNTLVNGEYKKETFSQYFKFEDGACIQTGHPDCLGELCYIAGKDAADYCNPW